MQVMPWSGKYILSFPSPQTFFPVIIPCPMRRFGKPDSLAKPESKRDVQNVKLLVRLISLAICLIQHGGGDCENILHDI